MLTTVWNTMDTCIRNGVTTSETHLPGGFNVRRRAPSLYKRLQQGFYPTMEVDSTMGAPSAGSASGNNPESGVSPVGTTGSKVVKGNGKTTRVGRRDHAIGVIPRRNTPVFPGIEYLSCMAIAVSC